MFKTKYCGWACFQNKWEIKISNVMDSTNMKTLVHRWNFLLCFLLCQERMPESPSPAPSLEENHRPGSQTSSHPSSSVSSSPSQVDHHSDRMGEYFIWRKDFKDIFSRNPSLGNTEGERKLERLMLPKYKWLFEVVIFFIAEAIWITKWNLKYWKFVFW